MTLLPIDRRVCSSHTIKLALSVCLALFALSCGSSDGNTGSGTGERDRVDVDSQQEPASDSGSEGGQEPADGASGGVGGSAAGQDSQSVSGVDDDGVDDGLSGGAAGGSSTGDHDHAHAQVLEIADGSTAPTIGIEVSKDATSGWNLRVDITDFRLAPELASAGHVDGEGHMHLYVDGVKTARLYSRWYHIGDLEPGAREIEVGLYSNSHAALAVGGERIRASQIVHVPDPSDDGGDPAPGDSGGDAGGHGSDGHGHGHGSGGHGSRDEPTVFDADIADADQTIVIEIIDGAVSGGHRRVKVEHGSVLALKVAADIAEDVHVHGYDILRSVGVDQPAHFAFTAEIPGVFEVELENSGLLVLLLEIS